MMILYQYRGSISGETEYTYLINLLKDGSLKFSKSSEFNDPFDCFPSVFWEAPVGRIPHFVADRMHRARQNAMSQYVGISCFTSHPDKMLMWSHYGDQHKGVCIGFDTDDLVAKIGNNSEGHPMCSTFKKVEYTNMRPRRNDESSFYKKSMEWQYEDEYRLVSICQPGVPEWGPGVWNVPVSSIKEIILGARMSAELESKIVKFVLSNNPGMTLKKVVIHSHTFDLLIENYVDIPHCEAGSGTVLMPNGEWRCF